MRFPLIAHWICVGRKSSNSSKKNEAYAVLKEISLDEKLREEARYREKAWRDELDRLQGAEEKGLKKGEKKGYQNVVQYMLSKGYSSEEINNITGIPIDEIVKQ